MADEDKTFTQADVDRFVAEERRRNKEEIDKLKAEVDDRATKLSLAEKAIEEKEGLVTQADERLKALEGEVGDAKAQATRFSIALDAGLPKSLAARLQGDDEEAIKKDAEELAALLKEQGKREGGLPGPTETPDEPKGMNELIREAAGRA